MDIMFYILLIYLKCIIATSYLNGTSLPTYIESLLDGSVYNKKERPFYEQGVPVVVGISAYIGSLGSISETSMDFAVTMFVRQTWVDPRLRYTPPVNFTGDKITLHHSLVDKIWVPDTYIENEKTNGIQHDITIPNIQLTLTPEGRFFYSQRISSVLNCHMNLANYPMDEQICLIVFESYGHTTQDMIMRWIPGGNSLDLNSNLQLPEFNLTKVAAMNCSNVYFTGSYGCVKAEIHLRRLFTYYFIQVYMPSILIVILSWVSFWIDLQAVPARISVGMLTVLTISTQAAGISSSLPRVSYLKALDIWIFTCMMFVFGAFIEYAIVNMLARRQLYDELEGLHKPLKPPALKQKSKEEEDLQEKTYSNGVNQDSEKTENGPLPQISLEALIELNKKKRKITGVTSNTIYGRYQRWKIRIKNDKALLVDNICRVAGPMSFTLFNLIYWCWLYQNAVMK